MQKNITTQRLFTALSDKELILHYQPILEADSGELSGIESLVRWQSPDLGLVTAKHLVPFLLQDESLSAALDGWTMREALTQAAMWKRQGFRFGSMAVNVLSWYRGRGFVTMVAEALATSGADPRLLALEAHNTMLSAGPLEVLLHTTHALAKQGITLAIDHFSWQPVDLDKVMQIPVHFVKSDAKTLDDWQEADKAKAKKVIRMLQKNGIQVMVVGVESADKQKVFHKLGIHLFQGRVFRSPLVAKQVSSLLDLIQQTRKAHQF